jgi:hypothetical protein
MQIAKISAYGVTVAGVVWWKPTKPHGEEGE